MPVKHREVFIISICYRYDDMNYIETRNGKMYLTSLYNYVQPLIRYEISDQLTLRQTKESRYPYEYEAKRSTNVSVRSTGSHIVMNCL